MRTETGTRGRFGKRDAAERPADSRAAGGRQGSPDSPGQPAPSASQGRDLHPQHVRRDHSLSEIF